LDAHDLDLGALPIDSVVALIERAGLHASVVPYGTAGSSTEQRGDQVTLRLTAAGDLAAIDAG
jgi:hypothetical protein